MPKCMTKATYTVKNLFTAGARGGWMHTHVHNYRSRGHIRDHCHIRDHRHIRACTAV